MQPILPPNESEVIKSLGPYQLIRSLGKGGMGEVFLAFDQICERYVAFKQIRDDLRKYKRMHHRFLKEARITATLHHPAIVPIYAIHIKHEAVYYTMPYIEGQTLKQVIRDTISCEKENGPPHSIGSSIPHLIRIFLPVCQAIAYAQSRAILHRDIKPENVLIGKFGEVIILDWGLAERIDNQKNDLEEIEVTDEEDLTTPGKVVGTLNYLAPERADGSKATVCSEVYALGIMLYQLLTLQMPFKRKDLKHFQLVCQKETLQNPAEVAPYRDIPHFLAKIAMKCLSKNPEKRYQSVEKLIADLEDYIEGKPTWAHIQSLKIEEKEHWEFQENVLMTKQSAITRSPNVMEWMSLMISKEAFPGNVKIEARFTLDRTSHGLGFLLGVSREFENGGFEKGYCIWFSRSGVRLFRSNVEVARVSSTEIHPDKPIEMTIEKREGELLICIDDLPPFTYTSHMPLIGTHLGLLMRDSNFTLHNCDVYLGGQNVMVNCLRIPDALLAEKHFEAALEEYRRIAFSFPGRSEGLQAQFRAGLTLIEQSMQLKRGRKKIFDQALKEFDQLHDTPGEPLEYLGKALVYKAAENLEEEMKCLELPLRKYPHHPLLPILKEHILFRLHEAAGENRLTAYCFALLTLSQLPNLLQDRENQQLIDNLNHNMQPLWFCPESNDRNIIAAKIAFWLGKPRVLQELIENNTDEDPSFHDLCVYLLLKLNCQHLIKEIRDPHLSFVLKSDDLKELIKLPHGPYAWRSARYLVEKFLYSNQTDRILPLLPLVEKMNLTSEERIQFNAIKTLAELAADQSLDYSTEHIEEFWDVKPQQALMNAYCAAKMLGPERSLSFFSPPSDARFPPLTSLLRDFLHGKIDLDGKWWQGAFYYEKSKLLDQLLLFYRYTNQPLEEEKIKKRLKQLKII